MTLHQELTQALKRAKYCMARKKDSTPHFHEAVLANARILVRENQRAGKSYSRVFMNTLRKPARGRKVT